MDSDQAFVGPTHAWQFFKSRDDGGCHRYLLSYYSPLHWEFSNGCLGAVGRTPWTAWWRWNRWHKIPLEEPR